MNAQTQNVVNTNAFGGTTIAGDGRFLVTEALKQANLDFSVEKRPLFLRREDGELGPEVPETSAIVRCDNNAVVGTVGSRYHPIQNNTAFDVFQMAFDEGLLEADVCGSIDGGRIVWVQAKVTSGPMQVIGDDRVQPYVILANSHDGSVALRAGFTAVRLFCMNQMAAAQRQGSLISLRHTRNVDVSVLREGILSGQNNLEKVVKSARDLSSKKVRGSLQLNEFTRKVFELDEPEVVMDNGTEVMKVSRTENRIAELFETGKGSDYAPIRGSWWSAYNAVTEYLTHHRGRSGESRAKSVWFGSGSKIVGRALEVAQEMAN